ncbi:MAG TPA: PilZ domain-containing protein [Polyangiaceae bacterium]|jgi:hypothetical protein|nr:PilZ domain-containing protein [Polyangiaceae bacterium]
MNQATMDRRQGARLGTDIPLVTYRDGVAFHCRAVDLSSGGALVYNPTRREPPLLQRIELTLNRSTTISALARTIWSSGRWIALRFVGLDDVDRLDIAEHLDARPQ